MAEQKQGYVYLLTNPAMPGLVKIGMTTREDLDKRLNELYSTGVPMPFECVFAAKVKNSDCAKIESALHTAFAPNRVNKNREFFSIQPEQALAILKLFHHEDATEEVTTEIENDLTADDKEAVEQTKKRHPALNFYEMGFRKGDRLIWKDDHSVFVTVETERKVLYKGEEASISALSAQLKGYNTKHIAPGNYWEDEEGKLLNERYAETYLTDD